MVTADPRHRAVLKRLAHNYIDADAALGKRVGFVFFGGARVRDYEFIGVRDCARTFIAGEFVTPIVALREFAAGDDVNQIGDFYLDQLANQTAGIVDEWMALIGVKRESLPALCVLVKGADPAIVELGADLDESELLVLFGRLADIAQRDSSEAMRVTFDAEHRLQTADRIRAQFAEHEDKLAYHLDIVCNIFRVTGERRQRMVNFLAAQDRSAVALDRLFAECGILDAEGFENCSNVRAARSRVRRLAEAIDAFEDNLPKSEVFTSLSESLDILRRRRAETAYLVDELVMSGRRARTIDRSSLGVQYDRIAGRVDQVESILEKLGKLAAMVGGAFGLTRFTM